MMEKVMISLSGRNQSWFDKKSKKEKKEYLASHPKSKFGPNAKTPSTKKKVAAKPVVKNGKKIVVKLTPKAGAKKSVKAPAKAPAKPAAKAKRPTTDKPVAKKAPAKKAAPVAKKKAAPKKKKEGVVHKDTAQIHEHAMKQKKAQIDKVIAPYARELGKLRTKRDAGGGLSNDESGRYKQLLETITKLHKGRND